MLLNQWNRGLSAAAALGAGPDFGTACLRRRSPRLRRLCGGADLRPGDGHSGGVPSNWPSISGTAQGAFQYTETLDFTTPVNRVTQDVELHVTPNAQQVTLTVDYLTDLNGDGAYELLTGQDTPVWDVLTASGSLAAASSGVSTDLTPGRTYTISADDLLRRGTAAIQDRTTSGSTSYLPGLSASSTEPESVIYMVTVTYYSSADDAEYELCYYLRLYEELPAPLRRRLSGRAGGRLVLRRGGLCRLPQLSVRHHPEPILPRRHPDPGHAGPDPLSGGRTAGQRRQPLQRRARRLLVLCRRLLGL